MQELNFIFAISILIMSVVTHEVSHGYAASSLGDPTARLAGRLTLNPLRHLDPVGSFLIPLFTYIFGGVIFGWARPVPYNPYNLRAGRWGPALVAAAGPAANFLVALIFGILIRLSPAFDYLPQGFAGLASMVVLINIVLGTFNLVPIPPLDGSKVLFALLPYKYDGVRLFLERYWLIVLAFFLIFLWRWLIPAAGFLFWTFTGESFGSY